MLVFVLADDGTRVVFTDETMSSTQGGISSKKTSVYRTAVRQRSRQKSGFCTFGQKGSGDEVARRWVVGSREVVQLWPWSL